MTRVIYKYKLALMDEPILTLPIKHWPLSVGLDPQGYLCLWAKVGTDQDDDAVVQRRTRIVGTGRPGVPDASEFEFMGTVLMASFVWHIYLEILE